MLTRVEKTSVNENELCSQYMRWYLIGFEYVCIPAKILFEIGSIHLL